MTNVEMLKKQKFIKLDDEVAEVLRSRLEYDGNNVRIGGPRLDPSLYNRVDKVLQQFGGKWKSGKVQSHVFSTPPQDAIAEALGNGKVLDKKQSYQFFETPADIANRMVRLAKIDGTIKRILEPSAGNGAIIKAIYGHVDPLAGYTLDAVDIDPERCAFLRANIFCTKIFEQDFLTFRERTYERILMNPPFTGGQDGLHVMYAFSLLAPGGRLVAIIGNGKRSAAFQDLLDAHAVHREEIESGSFKGSGTMVGGSIVVLEKAEGAA